MESRRETSGEKVNCLKGTKNKDPFEVGAYFYFLKTIILNFTSFRFKVVSFTLAFGLLSSSTQASLET